jgi:hypothetical protein
LTPASWHLASTPHVPPGGTLPTRTPPTLTNNARKDLTMGFSLSDLNPVSLISSAAESVCDAVLPKNLEFIGDLLGLAADVESGNWMKCLDDLQDLTKDLPQQLAALSGQPSQDGLGDALMVPTFLEPSPPPLTFGQSPQLQPVTGQPLGTLNLADPVNHVASLQTVQPSKATSPDAFFGLSDANLMNAVRAGNIPDAVKNDPAQLRRLEARMNDITEMNHLITSMLRAIHDMNTQVIQNLRV